MSAKTATPANIRPRTSQPAKAQPAKAQPKVSETPAAVDFDSLPEAQLVTYVRVSTGTKVDREVSTPSAIKARVNAGFEATAKKGAPVSFTQQCVTPEAAEAFLKVAKLYATFKGMTIRGKVLDDATLNILVQNQVVPAATKSGSVVSYNVKVRETRVRTPEAIAKAAAKKAAKAAAK